MTRFEHKVGNLRHDLNKTERKTSLPSSHVQPEHRRSALQNCYTHKMAELVLGRFTAYGGLGRPRCLCQGEAKSGGVSNWAWQHPASDSFSITSLTQAMPLACRVHWSWVPVDPTGDTVKQRRATSHDMQRLLTTRSTLNWMVRQHLKCS